MNNFITTCIDLTHISLSKSTHIVEDRVAMKFLYGSDDKLTFLLLPLLNSILFQFYIIFQQGRVCTYFCIKGGWKSR